MRRKTLIRSTGRRPMLVAQCAAMAVLLVASTVCVADVEKLEQEALRAAVDKVASSVVRIETVGGLERVEGVLFGTGATTGLVVSSDGYIISSAFNFINQPASILVRTPDGTRKPAKLIANDQNRMISLLKIDVDKQLPVAEIAKKSDMRVGQWTIAVGRTFEVDQPNMSVGILSARSRIWGKAIQTDAAVSPNNYGGPLIDIHGRVMGLIVPLSPQAATAVAGVEWYDSGIGFAIPAEHIEKILPRLKKGEDLKSGSIGINFGKGDIYTSEPIIGACQPGSPAAEAGLKKGDRIVEIEGVKTNLGADVKRELASRYAGDEVSITILRDEKEIKKKLKLVVPPKATPKPKGGRPKVTEKKP